jgi:hypothetical protein
MKRGLANVLHLAMDSEERLKTEIYEKKDDLRFPIVNFSFIRSNTPAAPVYGVYISQLIQYSRASYQDVRDTWMLQTRKLLNQGALNQTYLFVVSFTSISMG